MHESSLPTQDKSLPSLLSGVICRQWAGWAIPLSHERFTLEWIIVEDPFFVSVTRRCFPSTLVLDLNTVDFSRLTPVDVLGVNGPLEIILTPPLFCSIILFDWNIRTRHWPNWFSRLCPVQRSLCGGVSDFSGSFKLLIRTFLKHTFKLSSSFLPAYHLGDLSGLIDCTVSLGMTVDNKP